MVNEEAQKHLAVNKLTRLMFSSHDFQQALSAATFLLEEVEQSAQYPLAEIRRFRCYETAMVIAYARPFSLAKGEVGPLKWKDTGLSMTAAEKSLHAKLIKHRNTVYGHSDAEFVEMRVMVLHQPLDHNPGGLDWVMRASRRACGFHWPRSAQSMRCYTNPSTHCSTKSRNSGPRSKTGSRHTKWETEWLNRRTASPVQARESSGPALSRG